MLYLSWLEIEGFRSFKDRYRIEFPQVGSVLLSGNHKGSTMSSGSGKSSLLIAISYILGFCEIPATELIPWDAKKIGHAGLGLTDGTTTYDITRLPKLTIKSNAYTEPKVGAAAEEELVKILKTPISLARQ
ncbi:MAG: AAA family ATPase, partial [Candidatus Saccharimonadales bacterium]